MSLLQIAIAIVVGAMVLWLVQSTPLAMPAPLRWGLMAVVTLVLCAWLMSAAGLASCDHVRLR